MAAGWLSLGWHWLAAGLVLFIPGSSLLAWLPGRSRRRHDLAAFLADGAALSISIVAVLAFWLSAARVKPGAAGIAVLYTAGAVLLAAGLLRRRPAWPRMARAGGLLKALLPAALLLAGVVAWRLYQARGLVLPAWVDSVHHTLIVRKMLEYGGLPPDLTPYIPADFFYHYGFHLVGALFAFIAKQDAVQSVHWFGQVINALVSLSVYRVALTMQARASEDEPAGQGISWEAGAAALAAAVLVGFAFQMPAYYVTWGRYTLLTGLVLLGPALAAAWEAWQDPGDIGAGVRVALLTAGLCTTHYFALLLLTLFLVVLGAGGLLPALRLSERRWALLRLAGWSILGVLVVLPWVLQVAAATRETVRLDVVNPVGQSADAWKGALDYLKYILYLIGPQHSHILMGLAGAGLLAALVRPGLRVLAAWALLLAALSLPWGIRFAVFRPDHFAIVLFFPASILLAYLLVSGVERLSRVVQPGGLESAWFRPVVFAALVTILMVWGMRQTRDVVNSATLLVSQGDRDALDWINENVRQDARFFINSVPWQGQIYRGVDGGYWLLPYTGRSSLLPPVLYVNGSKEYIAQINRWAERAGAIKDCGADFWGTVREAGLTHVYLRKGKGSLQPDGLKGCQGLRLIYEQNDVFLYEIAP